MISQYRFTRRILQLLGSTTQWQHDMNKRNEAGFTRCIGVLCRWLGARSIASISEGSDHNLKSGMLSKRLSS